MSGLSDRLRSMTRLRSLPGLDGWMQAEERLRLEAAEALDTAEFERDRLRAQVANLLAGLEREAADRQELVRSHNAELAAAEAEAQWYRWLRDSNTGVFVEVRDRGETWRSGQSPLTLDQLIQTAIVRAVLAGAP